MRPHHLWLSRLLVHISRVPWLRPKLQPLPCVTTPFVIHPLVRCLVETVEGLVACCVAVCLLDCGVACVCSAALRVVMVDLAGNCRCTSC